MAWLILHSRSSNCDGILCSLFTSIDKTNVIDFDIFRETREMFAFLAFITDPKYFLLFLSVVKIIFIKEIHESSFIGILNDET